MLGYAQGLHKHHLTNVINSLNFQEKIINQKTKILYNFQEQEETKHQRYKVVAEAPFFQLTAFLVFLKTLLQNHP